MAACLAAQQSPDLMRDGKFRKQIGSRLTCITGVQCLYYIYFIHTHANVRFFKKKF